MAITVGNKTIERVAIIVGGFSDETNFCSSPWVIDGLRRLKIKVTMYDIREPNFLKRLRTARPDAIFPACQGAYGEDGKLQGFLETMFPDTPYVGSGVNASAIGMNKLHTKLFCRGLGIEVADYIYVPTGQHVDFETAKKALGLPLVIKPMLSGASLGLHIVSTASEFDKALRDSGSHFGDLLVEQHIEAAEPYVEYVAGVLESHNERIVLPVCQIRADGVYDTDQKSGHSEYRIPAPISRSLTKKIQWIADQFHTAVGCHGLSRVDLMVDKTGKVYLFELNTQPGLLPSMTYAKMAEAAGKNFDEMLVMLLQNALQTKPMEIPRRLGDTPLLPKPLRDLLPPLPKHLQPRGVYVD